MTTSDDVTLARATSPPGDTRDTLAPEDFESPGAWIPTFMFLPIELGFHVSFDLGQNAENAANELFPDVVWMQ